MLEVIIPLILIVLGWVFYLNLGGKEQKFYKKGETFKDEFGDYFVEDMKKIVKYVEDLPKENQINIYEHLSSKFGDDLKTSHKIFRFIESC